MLKTVRCSNKYLCPRYLWNYGPNAPFIRPSQNGVSSSLSHETSESCPLPVSRYQASIYPNAWPRKRSPLTLSSEVPTDEGSIHILQKDDALLWCHTHKVIESVIREAAVTEAQQADAVLQLPCQRCTGKDTKHSCESQEESLEQRKAAEAEEWALPVQ